MNLRMRIVPGDHVMSCDLQNINLWYINAYMHFNCVFNCVFYSNASFGEDMLCRLAISLGGKSILSLAMENIPIMLQSGE